MSIIGTTRVRVIDAQIAVTTTDGTRTGSYRLITPCSTRAPTRPAN